MLNILPSFLDPVGDHSKEQVVGVSSGKSEERSEDEERQRRKEILVHDEMKNQTPPTLPLDESSSEDTEGDSA